MDEIQNQVPTQTATPQSKTKLIIIVLVVGAGLLFIQSLLSPENIAERAIESAINDGSGVDVDLDTDGDGSVKITGEDGSRVEISGEGSAKLPDAWPSSVPVLGDAKIMYSGTVSNTEDGKTFTATFNTAQSLSDVTSFYTDELGKNGWAIDANLSTGEGSMISASQGENVAVAYISSADNETSVTLNVQMAN